MFAAWDNFICHQDGEVEAVLRSAAGRLVLLYLPTYSPWLNPIEERPTEYHWKTREPQVHSPYPPQPSSGRTGGSRWSHLSAQKDQTYWNITLPDGSRAFVPDSWTESIGNHPSTGSQELALSALRNLGTINAELQDRVCAERSSSGAIASKFGCVGGRAVAHP